MLKGTEEMSREQLLETIKAQDEMIAHYEEALSELTDLLPDVLSDDLSNRQIASKIVNIESKVEKKVGVIRTGNPFYGQIVRVRLDLDHRELERIGYKFNIMEAGYISPDRATIVMTHRDGQKRKVVQYHEDTMMQHVENIKELIKIGVIEE